MRDLHGVWSHGPNVTEAERCHVCRVGQPAPDPQAVTLDVQRLAALIKMHRHMSDAEMARHLAEERAEWEQPDPLVTYTDPAGGPDWEPQGDEA